MKGLELSERFYWECGAPMLHANFAEIESKIAVGLVGSGSECFGYDDAVSQDHDFEPGFCIFLPGEDVIDRKTEFALERAYSKLPKEFMGFSRSPQNPVGGNRHGVLRMSDFFQEKTGTTDGNLSMRDWFFVPEQALAEATNGKIFRDDCGEFSRIRNKLVELPEPVRLKKLAGNLLIMGQAGQYNYRRCIARGETAAAQLAMIEFVQHAIHAIFLLNRRYSVYYKWSFRALREMPRLTEMGETLEYLISSGNGAEEAVHKETKMEDVSQRIIAELREQGLTRFAGDALEGHAYSVNDRIAEAEIRNLHILFAV